MKNMVYIQSGGPTSVINSSLYGAFKEAVRHPEEIDHIYGSINGIEGLIEGKLFDLREENPEDVELLIQTPGAALGTTRRKLPQDIKDPIYMEIVRNMQKFQIKYVLVNGGNDSMDTCNKIAMLCDDLNLDVRVIGVPKTIDNDLACTDHTLGYASAAKVVINTVYSISKDAACYKKGKVHIVEAMGRNVGWLAASADIVPDDGRPDLIYLPENEFDVDQFVKDVSAVFKKKGYAIVVISEGITFDRGESDEVDSFGHAQLSGAGAALAAVLKEKAGLGSRVVELSLMQRANPFLLSRNDRDEAIEVGKAAVEAALAGETGKMIVMKRVSNKPYIGRFELAPVSEVANAERRIPAEFMKDNTRMSDAFREYLRPLIEGNVHLKYRGGIVLLTDFKKKLIKA
ncbi:MAG: diphosphate--fructose-6-phosphate 1-phosphotransferase [Bacilli bacterium]|nr:diphosphate--fructose-6-phosphate 1-phosphotransferase [Bacilli bacterium]